MSIPKIEDALAELETLTGEIRVKLHLAGMNANDVWNTKLEPRLFEARKNARVAKEASKAVIHDTIAAFRSFQSEHLEARNPMSVADIMTREVRTCSASDSLNRAAQLMWENDCGALPVVDAEGKAIAMITDRDICMAAYTQGQALTTALVSTAASRGIETVRETDSVDTAEALMEKHQIRRVPVVDADGKPIGLVSMNDLARRAYPVGRKHDGLAADAVVRTLAAICRPSAPHAQAAE
jgi:CBS domain-containing protein